MDSMARLRRSTLLLVTMMVAIGQASCGLTTIDVEEEPDGTVSVAGAGSATTTQVATHTTATEGSPAPFTHAPPTLAPLEPRVVNRCAEHPEVRFEALGLADGIGLVVVPVSGPDPSGAMLVFTGDASAHVVPNTAARDGLPLLRYGPSPGGRWLEMVYANREGAEAELWWSAPDGATQWEVTGLAGGQYHVSISDVEIIVLDVPAAARLLGEFSWDDYRPVLSINPITGERRDLPELPGSSIFDAYFTHEGRSYAEYRTRERSANEYYLFDYFSETSAANLMWLTDMEGPTTSIPGLGRRLNGGFSVIVERPYGFDMAVDLSYMDLMDESPYDEIMTPVHLPGDDSIDMDTYTYEEGNDGPFPVLRFSTDGGRRLAGLYLFDYEGMTVANYCLDVALGDDMVISGLIYTSHDGRFLATTIGQVEDGDLPRVQPRETLVLDLTSGRFARIQGLRCLGWLYLGGAAAYGN